MKRTPLYGNGRFTSGASRRVRKTNRCERVMIKQRQRGQRRRTAIGAERQAQASGGGGEGSDQASGGGGASDRAARVAVGRQQVRSSG